MGSFVLHMAPASPHPRLRPSRLAYRFSMSLATAADLPSELITRIIEDLFISCHWAITAPFKSNYISPQEATDVLKNWSLVSIDWANTVRQWWFFRHEAFLCSRDEFELLIEHIEHGSTRLNMLSDVVQYWRLRQDWHSRSWCHQWSMLFHRRQPLSKKSEDSPIGQSITLQGPIPSHFPPSAFHSPHWSLPRSLPSCFLRFTSVTLSDIHFPSLANFSKLIRHFAHLNGLSLQDVVVDNLDAVSLPCITLSPGSGMPTQFSVSIQRKAGSMASIAPAGMQAARILRPGPKSRLISQQEWEVIPTLMSSVADIDKFDRWHVRCTSFVV